MKPVASTAQNILRGLHSVGLPWLDVHADPQRLLAHYTVNPTVVGFMNLHAWVLLAKTVGSPAQLQIAERELA